jgi:hypothetical protein
MRSNYRSVPFEITRVHNAYYLKAGDRRVMCDYVFESEDAAERYFRYNIDQADRRGRYPQVNGFKSKLEPYLNRSLP